MRKLASIQRVVSVEPIEGADSIEKITILGWQLVSRKDEFKVGELCVFFEVDSLLPDRPEFEFLRDKKFRIKTIRLRGQISQGIAFPISILPEGTPIEEELDVTELLGVEKWEAPEYNPMSSGLGKSQKLKDFPSFIPKTDETRIQAVPRVLVDSVGMKCYITEKNEGSSITCYLKDNEFFVCSRTVTKKDLETCHFWKAARNEQAEEKMRAWAAEHPDMPNFAIQGELIGPGVQGNIYKLDDYAIRVFNVFDIDKHRFLDFVDFKRVCSELGFTTVPILDEDFVITEDTTVQSLVELATRKSVLNDKTWAEGIVVRPLVETTHRKLGRFSFKIINPEYLLKSGR